MTDLQRYFDAMGLDDGGPYWDGDPAMLAFGQKIEFKWKNYDLAPHVVTVVGLTPRAVELADNVGETR